jgi:Ca2+-binding EF-hand superfamily protein
MDHHAERAAAFEEVTIFFDAIDKDGDGALSMSDIATVLDQLRGDANETYRLMAVTPEQRQEQCMKCMGALDRDGDGFVSRAEFTDTVTRWLQLEEGDDPPQSQSNATMLSSGISGGISNQLPSSPVAVSRRRIQAEIAAYFKQFARPPDAQALRRRVLSRPNRTTANIFSISHDFPVMNEANRVQAVDEAWAVLSEGRAALLASLYAFDWGVLVGAAIKVGNLLRLIEAFPDPVDRLQSL